MLTVSIKPMTGIEPIQHLVRRSYLLLFKLTGILLQGEIRLIPLAVLSSNGII